MSENPPEDGRQDKPPARNEDPGHHESDQASAFGLVSKTSNKK